LQEIQNVKLAEQRFATTKHKAGNSERFSRIMSSSPKKELLDQLPDQPGIYKFFDINEQLIYVGKAKDIKKRVSNYFHKTSQLDSKTRRLVSQINRIEYTIVNTEMDAFLLENSLIKEHQPRYNILLKDDKTYPFIYITKERFPKILSTRKLNREVGIFYGPYTSVKAMNTIIELIRKLYSLRTCNYILSEKNIEEKKFKICLEYHIGNCKGPCEGLEGEDDYNKKIEQAHHILKGNIHLAKNILKAEMVNSSESLDYEKAHQFKLKLDLLEKFQSSSIIVSPKITDLEVITIISDEKLSVVNYLKVINGTITQTKTLEIKKKLVETDEEILSLALLNLREELKSNSTEVISNIPFSMPLTDISISVPQIGDKKKLIDMSLKNIVFYLQKLKNIPKESRETRVLSTLQKDLQLKELPDHIECFDNSNLQGTSPVAAMVCFKNGKASKKDYRHFNIKTVIGANDFDSMHEIVFRRYKRCIDESLPLPKLIIIDGGKGQLNAACNALISLDLYGKIPIVGIAKRLEEIFYPGDMDPLYIDKKSESLKLIQVIRNEAHRFAINFHRDKRSKTHLTSEMNEIAGIGKSTFNKLLKEFKTLSNIKNASEEDLSKVIGNKRAKSLKAGLK
jgi:excinuclease ABC subunit C